MTDHTTTPVGGDRAPEIIQQQATEMRTKQDNSLQRLLRIATGALIVFLSVGTIAVAADDQLAPSTAVVVFVFAGAAAVGLTIIEIMVAYRWKEGPDIDQLLDIYRGSHPSETDLRLALTIAMTIDYDLNDKTIRHVRAAAAAVALTVFVGLLILIAGLYELT